MHTCKKYAYLKIKENINIYVHVNKIILTF